MKTETVFFRVIMGTKRKGIITIAKETGLPAKRIRELMSGSPGTIREWKLILNSLGIQSLLNNFVESE